MSRNHDSIIDVSDPNQLLRYGAFLGRYPDICPFCFSKYPEDDIEKTKHVIRCAQMARSIRNGDSTKFMQHSIDHRIRMFEHHIATRQEGFRI
jgi:hypothetical protein